MTNATKTITGGALLGAPRLRQCKVASASTKMRLMHATGRNRSSVQAERGDVRGGAWPHRGCMGPRRIVYGEVFSLRWRRRTPARIRQHDNFCSDADALVKIFDILVTQPDATARNAFAD